VAVDAIPVCVELSNKQTILHNKECPAGTFECRKVTAEVFKFEYDRVAVVVFGGIGKV
jgi:hypothetical protein